MTTRIALPFSLRSLAFAALSIFALLAAQAPARAADAATPDWPCLARKVLEVSPAQIWDGPSLEGTDTWRNDDTVRKLSEYLIARRIPVEEAEGAVKKYADAIPEAERDGKLTLLFAGVLSRINDERKVVFSGIERFHKRQLARAKEIEKQGITLPNQGDPLPEAPMPAGEIDKISVEEDKYKWDVRVFQERQQNIPIACEIPQLIEERAGAIARAIRANMKN
ncbi:MAG: hypothetical protein ABL907_25490 [Hyphomicrobium sp.]